MCLPSFETYRTMSWNCGPCERRTRTSLKPGIGAGFGFILPFSLEEARSFWRDRVASAVESGGRRVLIARWEGRIAGTVQLILDTPPNQRHRADVAKLLVHSDARRRGIARALMIA